MALTKRCLHHGIPSEELVQNLYRGLNDKEQNRVDLISQQRILLTI